MSRSRRLLLALWGLLLVGSLVHFVIPADDETIGSETATGDDDGETSPDQLAFSEETGRGSLRASGSLDSIERSDQKNEQTEHPLTTVHPGDGVTEAQVLPEPTEAFVATVIGDGVASASEPGGAAVEHWFPSPTQFGGERAFLVVDQTSSLEYVKVSLPVKPNGQEGWIPRSAVEIEPVNHRAVINLTSDSVTVWDGDEVIVETKAVTGKPATPTPVGTFYVRDIIDQQNPGGSYGPYIVALSGFSEVLDSFNGGLPALAIHGTNRPEQIGSERSSGCIRIPNELISLVAESVPLGTPVTIVA